MYLVTGGDFDNWHTETWDVLDSTEIFDPMVGRWVASGAKLPQEMTELRAVNIDDRVLIFGKMTILQGLKLIFIHDVLLLLQAAGMAIWQVESMMTSWSMTRRRTPWSLWAT